MTIYIFSHSHHTKKTYQTSQKKFIFCHNPNIGVAIKCGMQGPVRLKKCGLDVKHTLTNGGK